MTGSIDSSIIICINLPNKKPSITEKEILIMQLVADGDTSLEISNITGSSNRTIENHIFNLRGKYY